MLGAVADLACTPKRARRLARRHNWLPIDEGVAAWRNFIFTDHDVDRIYALRLMKRVNVHGELIVIIQKEPGG